MRLSPRLHADGIYLDHQATDRPRPEAVQAVMHFMSDHFGNANAGANERGRLSRHYLNLFRETAASLVGGRADTLLFTSGATESNNLVMSSEGRRRHAHLAVSAIEHKCVLESAERARRMGARVSILPVTPEGVVELEAVRRALADGATLVSVMATNNEIGTLQPIREISALCQSAGARFHTDAAQAIGKIAIDFATLGADYLTFTAHKFGGPQGIGGLMCAGEAFERLEPLLVGGGQEQGLRAGTTPLALCAGLAAAALVLGETMDEEISRMRRLRDRLAGALRQLGPFFTNSRAAGTLCNNLNGGFMGIPALMLMRRAPELHFSAGSACTGSGGSHVLKAIGLPRDKIDASFRLSVGWATTDDDIDQAIASFERVLKTFSRH
ncbi:MULTISPECIES: cysteine desulfurase family protein [unclassified Polaromonas]|uniref:cysteine desulfurase family protein n=1 Tax=unclassified Polaromonas TaxID=2638319 RepID=UPI000F0784E3|nr:MULTISPECIES: cysteine desulfurase family protein [unclassified Polaromonas]AYQ26948.1 cysteine desulfurase [Polaromonas sp. SP1]QGJ18206.1 aminotransferase class V-fold PLP-dependent enzyme [Polaromonas sp. Pch-P]